MRLAPPDSLAAIAMPWGGPRTPFVELRSEMDRWALVVAAVDAHSDATIRLWAEGRTPGLNGCLVQLRAGIATHVLADVVADGRAAAPAQATAAETARSTSKAVIFNEASDPAASRETTEITTAQPLPFVFTLYPLDAAVTDPATEVAPLRLALTSRGGAFDLSGSGELGWAAEPPFGFQVVSPPMTLKVAARQDLANVLLQAIGHDGSAFVPWLAVDLAVPSGAWSPVGINTGPIAKGMAIRTDLRIRVIGAGATWSAAPSGPAALKAALRFKLGCTAPEPPKPERAAQPAAVVTAAKTAQRVGPYESMAACMADQTARFGPAAARAACDAFAGGAAR